MPTYTTRFNMLKPDLNSTDWIHLNDNFDTIDLRMLDNAPTADQTIAGATRKLTIAGNLDVVGVIGWGTSQTFPWSKVTGAPAFAQTQAAVAHKFFTAYDASTGLFTEAQPDWSDLTGVPSSLVTTFNSRTGAVVPATNDYSFSQISGSVAATQLPTPGATTLGGVKSLAAVATKFLTSIGTDGGPVAAQPAFTDISGTATLAQLPTGYAWSNLGAASAALTLANGTYNTTFNHTSAVYWTWANTTAATATVAQGSPIFTLVGQYWTGSASAADTWYIYNSLANGTNGQSNLIFSHGGSLGGYSKGYVQVPAIAIPPDYSYSIPNDGTIGLFSYATTPVINGTNSSNFAFIVTMKGSFQWGISSNIPPRMCLPSGGIIVWSSAGIDPNNLDTYLYRFTTNTLGIAGNVASTGKFTNYNSITTVDNGVPSELAHVDATAQSAAIAATTLYTPAATGRFRVTAYLKVTTPGTTSTLGNVTLTFTDGTDSVAQSVVMGLMNQAGASATTNTGNSTTTVLTGDTYIYAKTGVAIQYAVGYASTGATAMQYEVHMTCEAM